MIEKNKDAEKEMLTGTIKNSSPKKQIDEIDKENQNTQQEKLIATRLLINSKEESPFRSRAIPPGPLHTKTKEVNPFLLNTKDKQETKTNNKVAEKPAE